MLQGQNEGRRRGGERGERMSKRKETSAGEKKEKVERETTTK